MIKTYSAKAKVKPENQDNVESLIQVLIENDYSPVMRNMMHGIYESVNLSTDQLSINDFFLSHRTLRYRRGQEFIGDIFLKNNNVYLLYFPSNIVETSIFGYNCSQDDLNDFCSTIKGQIGYQDNDELDWKYQDLNLVKRSRSYREDIERNVEISFKTPEYQQDDLEIIKWIKIEEVRKFIIKLSKLKKIIKSDSLREIDEDVLKNLLKSRLIKEEYLLKCRQDQHTICTIPSKDNLNEDPMQNFKCDCGRSLSEENIQTIYSLTTRCKKLLDGSLWMSVWITELLRENGANIDNIKWSIEANGEEIDIMVEDFGLRILFELKDREFGLGDSYAFGYRFDMFDGHLGLISTTDQIADNAKRFFEEQKRKDYPINVEYLEGVDGIQKGIIDLVESLRKNQARDLVFKISRDTGINFWPMIEEWIKNNRVNSSPTH